MNRRTFVSSMLGAAAMGSATDRIRIGFLGASHSHAWEKSVVVRESSRWELAGICEPDAEIREKYEKAGVRILSERELLEDPGIRVVAVESGVPQHAEHGWLVLEAGKHLHLEKPPADNLNDLNSLLPMAEKKKLLVQMGYMWRYHPGINRALEAARRGWLGRVYLVRGMMNTLIPAESRREWALFKGGQMFEQGCHLIDPMVRLLGWPQKVSPVLKKHGPHDDKLADNTVAVFEYPRALGIISSSVLQPGANRHRSFEVMGSNGTAVVRPIEPAVLEIDLAEAAGPYRAGIQRVELPPFRRYVGEFEELAEKVSSGQPLSVTPKDDLLVQEALLLASEML